MKNQLAFLVYSVQKIDRQHIQLALVLITLALLAIGVGAPNDSGSIGPH